jgi:two-component system sensor kinase FixL
MYRIYGLDPTQPVTLARYLERLHPDDRGKMRAEIDRAIAEQRPFEHWHRIIRPDGTIRTLHARGEVVTGSDGRPVRLFGTGRDITEEREREEQTRLLKEDVRLREDFLAIASHELRTPVTSLRLQIQIVQRLLARQAILQPGLEPVNDALIVLSDDSKRLVALVNRLLDVTRITTGQLDLQFEKADLREIAQAGIDVNRAELLQRAVALTVDLPVPVRGMFDRLRLEQVVANLLSNAIKHGEGQPVTVRVGLEQGHAVLTVHDKGRGIPADDLATIFNRFERGSVTSARTGLGLGLYISRQIVEAHGGAIDVSSEIGAGTTFTVRLPVGASA